MNDMPWKWTCIACLKPLSTSMHEDFCPATPSHPPLNGLVFCATGNYGSSIFDPCGSFKDQRQLEVAICDECVEKHKEIFVYAKELKDCRSTWVHMTYDEGREDERADAKRRSELYDEIRQGLDDLKQEIENDICQCGECQPCMDAYTEALIEEAAQPIREPQYEPPSEDDDGMHQM